MYDLLKKKMEEFDKDRLSPNYFGMFDIVGVEYKVDSNYSFIMIRYCPKTRQFILGSSSETGNKYSPFNDREFVFKWYDEQCIKLKEEIEKWF